MTKKNNTWIQPSLEVSESRSNHVNHKSTFLDFHKTKASVHRLVMYSSFTCGAT
ncbi:unnamed protein product, partial [Musa banksii]